MTGVDKILVIIVLVFSVVFVIAAIGGFSKHQQQLQAKDGEIETWKGKAAQSDSNGRQTMAMLEQSQKAKAELEKQLQDAQKTSKDKDDAIKVLGEKNSVLEAEIGQYKNTVDEFKGRLEALKGEVAKLTEKFDEMVEANKQYREEAVEAKGKVSHYENTVIPDKDKKILELEDRVKTLEKLLKADGGPEKGPGPEVPKISCTVLDVRRGEGPAIVGLDKGSKDDLSAGVKMYVWNSIEGLKGRVIIIETSEETSIARIEWEKEGLKIKNGDTATVQDFGS